MRQLRFGSYSTAATLAGTPSLVRLKSTIRYCCLWPPPLWRAVLRPYELRPPVPDFGASSVFSGVDLVMSEKSETVWNRRPGLVGLRLRRAIGLSLEEVDRVAGRQGHDRPLAVGSLAPHTGAAVDGGLALAVERVHLGDLHVEDRLDRRADLGLGGIGVDEERVDVVLDQPVGLLAHHRLDDDVAGVLHAEASSVSSAVVVDVAAGASDVGRVSRVKTMTSFTSTS